MSTKKCNRCKHILTEESFKKIKNGTVKIVNKCQDCRDKTKQTYIKIKNNKVCVSCLKHFDNIGPTCIDCKDKKRIESQEKRNKAKINKMCTSCFIRVPEENYKRCSECRESRRHIFNDLSLKQRMLTAAKSRATRDKIEFNLTENDIILPKICPVFGYELVSHHGCHKYNSYSLDRIDNSKGYIPGNIHIISMKANSIKRDSSLEELESLVKYLKSLIGN